MSFDPSALLLSVGMAVAAGLVGCFAVMRRMTLASDAISHIALPGIGIALALRIHPVVGAAAMLFFGVLLIWAIEGRTRISTETVIGVVFSAALAVGTLITSGEDLLEALLGGATNLSTGETVVGLAASAAVIAYLVRSRHQLVIALVSPDIATTLGIDVRRLDLVYLFAFALTVALGLRYLGVLLMGSLIIIPAATAKRLAGDLRGMMLYAVGVALLSTLAGTGLAAPLHRPTGPIIVTIAAGCFFLSLLRRSPAGTS